ncbi:hypothetical protein J6590_014115 [Homalodisca vitripennis]|nr:hypothetical protein J6590_014115 [Homalodisca vitripennis]
MAYNNIITGDPMMANISEPKSENSFTLEQKSQNLETLSQDSQTSLQFETLSQEFNLSIESLEEEGLGPKEDCVDTSAVETAPVEVLPSEKKGKFSKLSAAFFNKGIVEITISHSEDEGDDREHGIASFSKKIIKPANKENRSASSSDKIIKLPQSKIKSIMKKDPEVSNPNNEAVFLVSKATRQRERERDNFKF